MPSENVMVPNQALRCPFLLEVIGEELLGAKDEMDDPLLRQEVITVSTCSVCMHFFIRTILKEHLGSNWILRI